VILGALALTFPLGIVAPAAARAADQSCNASKPNYIDQTPAAFAQLGITAAQRLSDGEVRVAVVDSGVDAANTHFKGGVIESGKNFASSGDGRTDPVGQGTAIAGQIAAREVNGSGVVGIAPKATIIPVTVYNSEQSGKPSPSKTADGIRWAAENHAQIIVVSDTLSTTTNDSSLKSAVSFATKTGALVVAAAGDVSSSDSDDPAVRFPAGYDDVLSVTSLGSDGKVASNARSGAYVGLAAPGTQVLTTFQAAGDCMFASSQASTTFAAGYAAGIAALVAAAHPDESPADWRYRLLATALRPTSNQRNDSTGWGIIAPVDAINFINDGTRVGPTNPRFPTPSVAPAPLGEKPNLPPADSSAVGMAAVTGLSAVALVVAGVLLDLLRRRRNDSATSSVEPTERT
jgi:membrane-anchored mycosin MYCP